MRFFEYVTDICSKTALVSGFRISVYDSLMLESEKGERSEKDESVDEKSFNKQCKLGE